MEDPTTFGDLKRLVQSCERGDWPSRVNTSMTHNQALDVLRDGLATHPDEMLLAAARSGLRYKRNVLREVRTR